MIRTIVDARKWFDTEVVTRPEPLAEVWVSPGSGYVVLVVRFASGAEEHYDFKWDRPFCEDDVLDALALAGPRVWH